MISHPTILEHAQPVMTPLGSVCSAQIPQTTSNCILEILKRKDEIIVNCLLDKLKILTQMFNYTIDEVKAMPETMVQSKGNKEAKELVLAAIVQSFLLLSYALWCRFAVHSF